ncbi:hypothetical protein KC341_g71 [Hortaea werneckii]|nr:hypothetical protein KC341_g71 [Hortaea werneckii]
MLLRRFTLVSAEGFMPSYWRRECLNHTWLVRAVMRNLGSPAPETPAAAATDQDNLPFERIVDPSREDGFTSCCGFWSSSCSRSVLVLDEACRACKCSESVSSLPSSMPISAFTSPHLQMLIHLIKFLSQETSIQRSRTPNGKSVSQFILFPDELLQVRIDTVAVFA